MATPNVVAPPPRLHRRRMSAPAPRARAAPLRLPPCRPLNLQLEALDLSPAASPAQALASLRFLVLDYLADLERRLALLTVDDTCEWAKRGLDMLRAIRADVSSHIPDLPDLSVDMNSLKDVLTLKRPLSYVPTLSARLRSLHLVLADEFPSLPKFDFDFSLPSRPSFEFDFDFSRPTFDFDFTTPPLLRELLDAFRADVDAFLAELPSLPSLPALPSPLSLSRISSHHGDDNEPEDADADDAAHARALHLSCNGTKLLSYADLPPAWQNNSFVVTGYRFIPLTRPHLLILSLLRPHNESLNIHTHLIPFLLWGSAFLFPDLSLPTPAWLGDVARYTPFAPSSSFALASSASAKEAKPPLPPDETLFTLLALTCLFASALWHTMAGCASKRAMEGCARVDYVGIGWLIAGSVATVVHHGYANWPAYHPVGAACLALCAAAGVSGNVLPFCEWFNRVEYRLYRTAFFVGISFSALAPLAGIAALQGWGRMVSFVAPLLPSLGLYLVGLVFYTAHVPERFGPRPRSALGPGSHAIWHICIVLAIRAHRDGIREMRRQAAEGGCAAR
ncbi:hemolysin-III related-domain-containing protein [Mycena filopes]|nr:hemolysin-III related-domain-containing protein [Mycena filopes]